MNPNRPHKRKLQIMATIWIYDLVKFALAFRAMTAYHINPWIFLFLDLVTVPTYVLGWAGLLASLTGPARSFRSMACLSLTTMISSTAPYLYAAWAGRQDLPIQAWALLGAVALFPLINMGRKLLHLVRTPPCPARIIPDPKAVP